MFINNNIRKIVMNKHNKKVYDFAAKSAQIDSIKKFPEFQDYMTKFEKIYEGGLFNIKASYGESLYYGHIQQLFRYCNMNPKDYVYFPIMEHGIQFVTRVRENQQMRIFQGKDNIEGWRKYYKGYPFYMIGPYIHYVESYYESDEIAKYKSELGKVLTIFPAHTYELADNFYNEQEFVDYIMDIMAKDYDSVIISVYWADVNAEVYKLFKERGAILMSAGFRGDTNFIRRLKTILELSDTVVSNAFGTFIGYAYYLNKVVKLIDGNVIVDSSKESVDSPEMENELHQIEKQFMRAFAIDKPEFTKEQLELCEYYWGLDKLKTKEEIQAILKINKQILKEAKGFIKWIPWAAQKVMKKGKLTELEYSVLSEAMGE